MRAISPHFFCLYIKLFFLFYDFNGVLLRISVMLKQQSL